MTGKTPTIDTLPRRRGVVMRADGISDTYGKRYVRDLRSGALRRVEPKQKRQ